MNNWKKLAKKLSLDYNQVKKSAAIEWASTNCEKERSLGYVLAQSKPKKDIYIWKSPNESFGIQWATHEIALIGQQIMIMIIFPLICW